MLPWPKKQNQTIPPATPTKHIHYRYCHIKKVPHGSRGKLPEWEGCGTPQQQKALQRVVCLALQDIYSARDRTQALSQKARLCNFTHTLWCWFLLVCLVYFLYFMCYKIEVFKLLCVYILFFKGGERQFTFRKSCWSCLRMTSSWLTLPVSVAGEPSLRTDRNFIFLIITQIWLVSKFQESHILLTKPTV